MLELEKLKIAVLYGGIGSEREVSLESGKAVSTALKAIGLNIEDVIVDGSEEQIAGLDCDVAFLALHGEFGEDGQIQDLLEKNSILYTGSNVDASRLAMDKARSKVVFKKTLLPTAPWFTIKKGTDIESALFMNKMSLPCVVKPNSRGSSVGVHIVREDEDFAAAVDDVFKIDDTAIVEKFISGRELTVGVVGDQALPVIEMEVTDGFYDYQAKYQDGRTSYHCPADINSDIEALCKAIATSACKAIGTRDMSRVDFILSRNGLVILEINTIPGFTSHSLLPMAAQNAGMTFTDLCLKIIELALKRKDLLAN